jgi:hypothetical protein
MNSILFVLRRRTYNQHWGRPYGHFSSGLLNSARFVNEMLVEAGVKSKLVEVVDSNEIDREVTRHDPDVVILEAIWCPPSKLRELVALRRHHKRRWIVRNHSEMPFLAMEGISIGWLLEYAATPSVEIASNSPAAREDLNVLMKARGLPETVTLPNFYPTPAKFPGQEEPPPQGAPLDVACFGAIRPLKNHLEQALAAIALGQELGRPVNFHVNATRLEGNAEPILKSLRSVFDGDPNNRLVEHDWMEHHEFKHLCRRMHIGLQVSFSETFNIVAADLVSQGVPVVGSEEIPWLPEDFQADPHAAAWIATVAKKVLRRGVRDEFTSLRRYCQRSRATWLDDVADADE